MIYKMCNSYLTPPVGLWNGNVVQTGPTDPSSSVSLGCQIWEISVQVQVLSCLSSNDPSIVASPLFCNTETNFRIAPCLKGALCGNSLIKRKF